MILVRLIIEKYLFEVKRMRRRIIAIFYII